MELKRGLLASLKLALLAGVLLSIAVACSDEPAEEKVTLLEIEGSGQSGSATLTPMEAQTEVVVEVTSGPAADDPQPLHIHFGSCGPNLGEVKFPLTDLTAGKSTTVVDASISSLTDGQHNINLHKSYPDIRTYTSCGNIPSR